MNITLLRIKQAIPVISISRIVFWNTIYLSIALAGCNNFGAPGTSTTGTGTPTDSGTSFFFNTLNFIFMGFFAYYFIVLKPKTQDEDNQKKFLEALSKNDEVVTTSGIIGRVVQKKSEIVTLEISPKVNVKVLAKELRPLTLDEKSQDKTLDKSE